MTRMFRTNITRRFAPDVSDVIEIIEIEILRNPSEDNRYARDLFLTSLIISDDDGNASMADTIVASSWMMQQGRVTWERGKHETIVRYEECLN